MRQVLVWIPLKPFSWLPSWWPDWSLPVYGFGVMLCVALLVCTWLASRRARREGIAPQIIQDLAVWIFVGGIVGARTVFMIQYHEPVTRFFMIWQGGLVFYGSAIGGVVGYFLGYWFLLRGKGISTWQLADVIAPSAAVGLCLGRVGCLLNGCCYGNVACEHCLGISFPLSSPARYALVEKGLQTAAGFTLADGDRDDPRTVKAVGAGSQVGAAGLKPGDVIIRANGQDILPQVDVLVDERGHPFEFNYPNWGETRAELTQFGKQGRRVDRVFDDLSDHLTREWPRGQTTLALTVRRGDRQIDLSSVSPETLALHPTQVYESISMVLLFLVLTAYFPFRRQPGEVMVIFILGYSVHRFLNEVLRNDTEPIPYTGMTLSQNGSIFFFVVGLGLALWFFASRPKPGFSKKVGF